MHLNNAYDDQEMFTIQSFRIRRPFDFANRTGVIAFDVGAKSQMPGGHARLEIRQRRRRVSVASPAVSGRRA
jgi:hypothetical protein